MNDQFFQEGEMKRLNDRMPCQGTIGWGLLCLFVFFGTFQPLLAWSERGHHLTARLAEAQLTPQALTAARELLGGKSLAEVSMWADQIKPDRPETAIYHYANFPAAREFEPSEAQGDDNGAVVPALEGFIALLGNPHRTVEERAEALRFIVHLVGDIHQPMHCSPRGDQGGNKVAVWFFGRPRNLHQVWDRDILASCGIDEETHLEALKDMMNDEVFDGKPGTPAQWAAESNRLAIWHAYRLPWNNRLDERYVEPNLRLANRQIIKAGRRLTAVLNQVLGQAPLTETQNVARRSSPETISASF